MFQKSAGIYIIYYVCSGLWPLKPGSKAIPKLSSKDEGDESDNDQEKQNENRDTKKDTEPADTKRIISEELVTFIKSAR